jgi:tetratricopeptide (TPR) repeat protein
MLAAAGNMHIAAGQYGKAAVALDRALAGTGLLADQRGLALLDRARAAEAQGDLKTARDRLNKAAETISADPFLWYFSAALAIRENKPDAAKSAINRALAMIPNDPTVLFEAGHVYAFAGEETKARDHWARAMAADPNGPSGQAAKRALALLDVPLTVTNQVARLPNGDGEGPSDR